jgi:hypothetical protein
VTRGEYLDEATLELKEEKNQVIARVKQEMPVRPDSVQRAEKAAEIEQINQTCSGMQLQVRLKNFEASYKSDETYQKEMIAVKTERLDSLVSLMSRLLSRLSKDALQDPAFVSVPADAFEGFEDGGARSGMLVRLDPAYASVASQGIDPHVFVAYWLFDPANAEDSKIDQLIEDQFEPGKLKKLLVH